MGSRHRKREFLHGKIEKNWQLIVLVMYIMPMSCVPLRWLKLGASEIVQRVEVLVSEPDNLSWISIIYIMKGEN